MKNYFKTAMLGLGGILALSVGILTQAIAGEQPKAISVETSTQNPEGPEQPEVPDRIDDLRRPKPTRPQSPLVPHKQLLIVHSEQ